MKDKIFKVTIRLEGDVTDSFNIKGKNLAEVRGFLKSRLDKRDVILGIVEVKQD